MRIKSGDMISREFPICIYLICGQSKPKLLLWQAWKATNEFREKFDILCEVSL